MKLIYESPEHHFLTFLEKVKQDPGGWVGYRFAFSRRFSHIDMISKPELIGDKLSRVGRESDALAGEIMDRLAQDDTAVLYRFRDGDLVLLARPGREGDRQKIQSLFQEIQKRLGDQMCESSNLAKDIYGYQKLADRRLLSANRIKAWEAMGDENRTQSIVLRRERRAEPVIMIVEDDRFTASYTAGILNKDYDIVLARTGEEAISLYVEHAPDAVFLDIHLPGLDGMETLRALRRIDPQSYIFMLSVDTVAPNIVTARAEGAAGFLKKPFGRDRLMAAVSKSPFIKTVAGRPV